MAPARPAIAACPEFRSLTAVPRRSVLAVGGFGLLQGLLVHSRALASEPTPTVTPASENPGAGAFSSPGFGKAKRALLLFMWGGPSHLDTFDLKPQAPAEIRGPFQPISTSAAGVEICQHFRRLAGVMHHAALVRSLAHDDPAHLSSAHTVLTGHLPPVNKSDAVPPSERDTPHLGAMLARLRGASAGLPGFVTLPWLVYHPAAPGGRAPGQHGGWLGRSYDPLLIEGDPSQPGWSVPALSLMDGQTTDRLDRRFALLHELDRQRRTLDAAGEVFAGRQSQALDLLTSPQVRRAFDLSQEPDAVRDRYGRNIHGQSVLLARRLLEHGVPFVSVNWHNDGVNFWDTHGDNFRRLEHDLIPPSDAALASVLEDLHDRGMLEDTLVVWVGEFGRRPTITAANAGREHYPYCYSGLLAGGGVRGGSIVGASDKTGSRPATPAISPHDVAATMLHSLGVPPEQKLPDRAGRPLPLYAGRPIDGLFG